MSARPRIAVLLNTLRVGGVECSWLRLARLLAHDGYEVDLVLGRAEGPLRDALPAGPRGVFLAPGFRLAGRWHAWRAHPGGAASLARTVVLCRRPSRALRWLGALSLYLAQERPAVLIAAKSYPNLVALWARERAGVATRVVCTEHTLLSHSLGRSRKPKRRGLPRLIREGYPHADAVVTPSAAIAADLVRATGLSHPAMRTVPNPLVDAAMAQRAGASPGHPWYADGEPPVLLSVGRLSPEKDLATTVRAFAMLRRKRPLRLLLLGEGKDRDRLARLAASLGVAADVGFHPFVANPLPHMARAALLVSSSRYEGFGNVLVEAMACGTPVVATDCGGPGEILAGGRYGRLVPVGHAFALAEAIDDTLAAPPEPEGLRARATLWSEARALASWRDLLEPWL